MRPKDLDEILHHTRRMADRLDRDTFGLFGHLTSMIRFVTFLILIVAASNAFAEAFPPDDVKILGDLSYGQTSQPAACSTKPPYRAFVFSGKGGDRVDVVVKSSDRQAFVAIADPSLNVMTSGATHVSVTIPNRGPDAEAFYIVFRDSESKDAQFTVELKKLPAAASE